MTSSLPLSQVAHTRDVNAYGDFHHRCAKMPDKKLCKGMEGFPALQFRVMHFNPAGKAWGRKQSLVGHIASIVKRQSEQEGGLGLQTSRATPRDRLLIAGLHLLMVPTKQPPAGEQIIKEMNAQVSSHLIHR